MNLNEVLAKIKTTPWLRIVAALAVAGVVFFLVSSVLNIGALVPVPADVQVSEKAALEGGPSEMIMPPRQPTPMPDVILGPLFVLLKPALYIILFLIIYLLFFKPREPQEGGGNLLLYFALVVVLLVFVISAADLLRMALNYYLDKKAFTQTRYLFERFARSLAKRMAALLLAMPICTFLNLKASGKGPEVKGFFLALLSLTGIFSLLLAYWLLNGLFVWGFGVKGVELQAYTFPLAYFSILFPVALFYLVQYLRR